MKISQVIQKLVINGDQQNYRQHTLILFMK